jgi:hypothetical protein
MIQLKKMEEVIMLAYGIKVYLVNGDWGYISNNGYGGFDLTKNDSEILCFATLEEVKEFYYNNVKYGSCNGVAVDTSKTAYVRVQY